MRLHETEKSQVVLTYFLYIVYNKVVLTYFLFLLSATEIYMKSNLISKARAHQLFWK